jgi:hypothetical protein
MIRNTATETMSFSQSSQKMMAADTGKAKPRKARSAVLMVLFAAMIVALAWTKLVPLIHSPVDGNPLWKGVDEQLVSERMVAGNGKNWNAGFTLFADDQKVLVKLNIKLIQQDGVRAPALDKRKQVWLQGIDETWNGRFYLRLPDQRLIPVVLDVNFKPVDAHHEVVVRKGSSNPDQHNWYMNTGANGVAHEIGHMLGAYDEYRHGATSPLPVTINDVSLMGNLTGDGVPRVRHLRLLLDKLKEITGLQSLLIVQPGLE